MAARSKNQARRSGRSGTPGWAWLLVGLLIGGAAFGYLQFREHWGHPGSSLPRPDAHAQARLPSGENAVPEAVEKPKPKYDFYTLLPEKEVVIPDAELAAQARAEAARPPPPAAVAANASPAGVDPAGATAASTDPMPTTTGTAVAGANASPRFLIQAGAFRGNTEAEALKAQIALTGEIARVEVAQINGNTVHRVRMGPYPNATALAAAKQALAAHGIPAQAIRVK
ncbi:MAG: SPOR domain-containing protein [Arenimonas sp.]